MRLRAGSLFAGLGGFDLAAVRLGWEVRWAAEIEPFARRVHGLRLPTTRQVGDVRALRPNRHSRRRYAWGRDLTAGNLDVDVLMAGWPCQDLSVAGLRAGLKGERSGLFWYVVRLARLLRPWPRWLVLENVPGLLSSHGGADFAEVLGALVGGAVVVPAPGWPGAGVAVGPAGSVAWRILDAEHFGVPQRRRRLFLVRDSRGLGAPEVLFEPGGLSRDFAAGGETRACLTGGAVSRALGRVGGGEDPGGNKGTVVAGPIGAPTGGFRTTDLDVSGGFLLDVGPTVTEQMRHTGNDAPARNRIIVAAVTAKWAKQTGGPAGDEAQNLVVSPPVTHKPHADRGAADEDALVVADPIQANEGRTWDNAGKHARTHNVVLAPPAFEEAKGETDDALRADGEDQVATDGTGAAAGDGIGALGMEGLVHVAEVSAGDAGRDALAEPDGGHGQLVLFPRLPGALSGAANEPGLLAGEDPAQSGAGSTHGAAAPRPGHPCPDVVGPRTAGAVSPTLRDGGRSAAGAAGSSYDNTPVIFEARLARNGRGDAADVAPPLKAESGTNGKGDGAALVMRTAQTSGNGSGVADVAHALDRAPNPEAVVVGLRQITSRGNRANPRPGDPASTVASDERMAVFGFKAGYFTRAKDGGPADVLPPLSADADKGDQDPLVFAGHPRRLTPVECERLQGFPDGWSCLCGAVEAALADAGIPAATWAASDWRTLRIDGLTWACRCKDSARYRALGNAVAVPVVEWILARINALEAAAA